MPEPYGVMIAGCLVLAGGDDVEEVKRRGVDMYHQLHPDTDKNYLALIAEVKPLDEWKEEFSNGTR